jgi:hypothetical protein
METTRSVWSHFRQSVKSYPLVWWSFSRSGKWDGGGDFDYRLGSAEKDPVSVLYPERMRAREIPEGRQNCHIRSEVETRPTDARTNPFTEMNRRVHMPRHHKLIRHLVGFMAAVKWRQFPRTVDDFDVPCLRRRAGAAIMVPFHQDNRQCAMAVAPFLQRCERRRRSPGFCVDEIPQDDEALRSFPSQDRVETRQIIGVRMFGHGNSCGAKCGSLAKVRIGEEEGCAALPPDRSLRQQDQSLSGPVEFHFPALSC